TGPTGAAGADGTNGTEGANGTNGTNGANGTNGIEGASGTNGANGTNGTDGSTGPVGPNYIMGGSGSSVAANATVFTALDSQSGTEGDVQHVSPITQTFTKLFCFGPTPTEGTTDVFTVRVGGVSQTGTCTIPSGGTSVVEVTGLSIEVKAGELIDV